MGLTWALKSIVVCRELKTKNDDRNDWDKNKKYLLRKEIHQQLLGVKVTIIRVFQIKKSCAKR